MDFRGSENADTEGPHSAHAEGRGKPITVGDFVEAIKGDKNWGPFIAAASKALTSLGDQWERHRPAISRFLANVVTGVGEFNKELERQDYFAATASHAELLKIKGDSDWEAKCLPYVFQRLGAQLVSNINEARRRLKPLVNKLKKTTKNDVLVKSRVAAELLLALENPEAARLVESALTKAKLRHSFAEFKEVVSLAAGRDREACRQLGEIAESLSDHLPDARGRDVSLSVGVHMCLLYYLHSTGRYEHYKYGEEDFLDPVTRATRKVMGHGSFDPREATRRLTDYVPSVANSIDKSNRSSRRSIIDPR
jgi:hypothetical protein